MPIIESFRGGKQGRKLKQRVRDVHRRATTIGNNLNLYAVECVRVGRVEFVEIFTLDRIKYAMLLVSCGLDITAGQDDLMDLAFARYADSLPDGRHHKFAKCNGIRRVLDLLAGDLFKDLRHRYKPMAWKTVGDVAKALVRRETIEFYGAVYRGPVMDHPDLRTGEEIVAMDFTERIVEQRFAPMPIDESLFLPPDDSPPVFACTEYFAQFDAPLIPPSEPIDVLPNIAVPLQPPRPPPIPAHYPPPQDLDDPESWDWRFGPVPWVPAEFRVTKRQKRKRVAQRIADVRRDAGFLDDVTRDTNGIFHVDWLNRIHRLSNLITEVPTLT
ncbi:hypothetical protein H9P43_001807 [Blastocladiella emersonii ATCC 22665]|nr:hypothetical protein H9P43_001807 [Blastocladiella emersonii ATCC 22665]